MFNGKEKHTRWPDTWGKEISDNEIQLQKNDLWEKDKSKNYFFLSRYCNQNMKRKKMCLNSICLNRKCLYF